MKKGNKQKMRYKNLEKAQAKIDAHEEEQGSNLKSKSKLRELQQLKKKSLENDLENQKKELAALQKIKKKEANNKQK